jgi:hypothetical protein
MPCVGVLDRVLLLLLMIMMSEYAGPQVEQVQKKKTPPAVWLILRFRSDTLMGPLTRYTYGTGGTRIS